MPATRFDETSIWRRIRYTESYGHDNAADVPGAESSSASPSTSHQSQAADILTQSCHESHAEPKQDPITSPDNGPTGSARDIPSADDARHECHNSVVPHSHSNSGVGTHAYFQALNNRFVFDRFDPGGDLDPEVYTPVFLHDTLMLPGSLAQLIGKSSPLDIIHRLTPAAVLGFKIRADGTARNPHLLPSSCSTDVVHGILFLGSGKDSRRLIKNHYRDMCRRVRVDVHIEVQVPVLKTQRTHDERWRLEDRSLVAQAFVARHGSVEPVHDRDWTFERFLTGDCEENADPKFDAWEADGTAWQTEQPPPLDDERACADEQLGDGSSVWDVHATPVFGYGARLEDFEAMEDFGGW